MIVRNYRKEDYPIILSWWMKADEIAPNTGMLPLESSFVVEDEKEIPVLAVSLYLTNTKEVCYVENFIGNPAYKGPLRKEAGKLLQEYIENFAKEFGYKRLICLSYKEKIKNRYVELGYQKTLDNLSSFVKELV